MKKKKWRNCYEKMKMTLCTHYFSNQKDCCFFEFSRIISSFLCIKATFKRCIQRNFPLRNKTGISYSYSFQKCLLDASSIKIFSKWNWPENSSANSSTRLSQRGQSSFVKSVNRGNSPLFCTLKSIKLLEKHK